MNIRKIFVIAEAGVNHNGSLKIAKKLIDEAAKLKVDAIKFQTWKKGELTGKYSENVNYVKKNNNKKLSAYQLSNSYRLTYKDFIELKKYCQKKNLLFLTTPDGFDSLEFVTNTLKLPIIKIGSTELNHHDFLESVAKKNKITILSTGLGNLKEVSKAVKIIKKYNSKKLFVLQCTSEYPTPFEQINLDVLNTYKNVLKVNIGFSDHSLGYHAAIMAVALGATIIEKHFTLDKKLQGPDHTSSLNPNEFKLFMKMIKKAERIMGNGTKEPTPNELINLKGIRRGLVASRKLNKGIKINKSMIASKRPYKDFQPNEINKLIGKKLKVDMNKDQPFLRKFLH